MKNFFVKSSTNSFFLIEAFVKECKKLGISYYQEFTPFTEEKFNRWPSLYFSVKWNRHYYGPSCSLTGEDESTFFTLETEWIEALETAKKWKEEMRQTTCELNDTYTAIIHRKDKIVVVGWQEISFDRVEALYQLIKEKQ